jgi:hypothetical protein
MTESTRPRAGSNDNRHPPIPIPPGGFRTNAQEADWLATTIVMRLREGLAAIGINAVPASTGLRDLLLQSLDAVTKRADERLSRALSTTPTPGLGDDKPELSAGLNPPDPRDARIAELEAALREAIDDIQAWGAGSAVLNGSKDVLTADIAKYRRALGEEAGRATPPPPPASPPPCP